MGQSHHRTSSGKAANSPARHHSPYNEPMRIKVVVHDAEEGGLWAEVPAIPGCATQGETFEELLQNIREAINGCFESLK